MRHKKYTAVIIMGNPYYVKGRNARGYLKYYREIKDLLHLVGYDQVIFDKGEDYTTPPPADLWVGHSRGAGRLRFAPPNTKVLDITDYEEGIEEYRKLLAKEAIKLGYKSIADFPVYLRPEPGKEHFTLTRRAKEAILKLKPSK